MTFEHRFEEITAQLRAVPLAVRWGEKSTIPEATRSALIRELAAGGKSSAQIGALFGCTRNAIIGYAGRRKIPLRSPTRKAQSAGVRAKARTPAVRKDRPAPLPKVINLTPPPVKPLEPSKIAKRHRPNATHLLDIRERQCRFPLWDSARKPDTSEMMYCGDAKEDLKAVYCNQCSRITYEPRGSFRKAA